MSEGETDQEYIPGSCNIGHEEIARRYRIGYFGLFMTIMLILLLEIADTPRIWRVLICAPVALSLVGFLQATEKFCFAYGFRGVFSTRGFRKLNAVTDQDYMNLDRRKAITIVAKVIIGALIAAIAYYLLPV